MIPFKHHDSALPANLNNTNRLRLYRNFMGLPNLSGTHSLDIGEPGYISECLEVEHNTLPCDFNREVLAPSSNYNVITNFEVINHLLNPLQFLEQCRNLLAPGGVMYLSHPRAYLIAMPHCRFDFIDFEVTRFQQMVEFAGFKVVRHETRNPWPFRFIFHGFRPIVRVIFNRIEIWELRK